MKTRLASLCVIAASACAAGSMDGGRTDPAATSDAPGRVIVSPQAPGSATSPTTPGDAVTSPTPVDVGMAGAAAPDDMTPAQAPPTAMDPSIVPDSPNGMHVEHPAGDTVRFIAVGDTGTGDANQIAVANAMADKCAKDGCDFVVLLGDNLYSKGPTGVDDAQWAQKFETPYAAIDAPFYVVLGNHDVAAEPFFGSGYMPTQAVMEVQYTDHSDKWNMPATHYTLSAGPVAFLMLDTTSLYNHVIMYGDQREWIAGARDAMKADHAWVLSAGHHTYVSNGDHGNAGAYGYFDFDTGADIKSFFETNLCGQIDVVLTGHDHDRQWLGPSLCGGTPVIVSGAGGEVREGFKGNNPTEFQKDTLGFLYVVADAHTFTGQFIGSDGSVDFERTLTK